MTESKQEYLGDSVYAEYEGYFVILTTNNGYPDDPRNKIALEPAVYQALLRFVALLNPKPEPKGSAAIKIEAKKQEHRDEITKLESMASVLERVPEHLLNKCDAYFGKLDFNHLSREDSMEIISAMAAGKWNKTTNECYPDTIDYVGIVDGITVRLWAAAPPDSCRVIEVEEIIPEQRVMKRRLVCAEPEAEENA